MSEESERGVPAQENVIRSPELPHVATIPGGLQSGRSILIKGVVLPSSASDSRRFFIDLCCGLLVQGDHMDNKALHFNPRFENNSGWFSGPGDTNVVINSLINNQWGPEERYPNAFEEGKSFNLRILVLENYFKIAVNGKHLCDYAHRIPLTQVKTIYLGGCMRVDFVEFQPALSSDGNGSIQVVPSVRHEAQVVATLNKPMIPVQYNLDHGFVPHQTIQVTLTPFLSGERFTINFMRVHEWIFHFRVDLPHQKQKPAIIRNSTRNGKWLTEERSIGEFPFAKGITYDVLFTAFDSSIAVDVDGVPFIKFNYRPGDSPAEIDQLMIKGDVVVHRVVHKE